MGKRSFSMQRKIFGGTNFVVVLWALISLLRLGLSMGSSTTGEPATLTTFTYAIPLLFMAVLNIFIGITLFLPQNQNKMWVISMIIVTATLVVLNTFQVKINKLNHPETQIYKVADY